MHRIQHDVDTEIVLKPHYYWPHINSYLLLRLWQLIYLFIYFSIDYFETLTFARCRLHFRSTHRRVMRLSPMESLSECMLTYNIQKSKTEKGPEKPSTKVLPHVLVSLPALVKRALRGPCTRALEGISCTCLLCVKLRIITQNLQREEQTVKASDKKAKKMWPHTRFSLLLFLCACTAAPKSHPHFTTEGETSLKLAPIYGLCYCQTEIPPGEKKAH